VGGVPASTWLSMGLSGRIVSSDTSIRQCIPQTNSLCVCVCYLSPELRQELRLSRRLDERRRVRTIPDQSANLLRKLTLCVCVISHQNCDKGFVYRYVEMGDDECVLFPIISLFHYPYTNWLWNPSYRLYPVIYIGDRLPLWTAYVPTKHEPVRGTHAI